MLANKFFGNFRGSFFKLKPIPIQNKKTCSKDYIKKSGLKKGCEKKGYFSPLNSFPNIPLFDLAFIADIKAL